MDEQFDNNHIIMDKGTLADTSCFTEGRVTPIVMLSFAKQVLMILAIMFEMGCIFEFFAPGTKIYETCKLTIPAMATLVIGYYFGSSKQ